ncbi:helix-turn-helix transcriptional regulator [Aerococcaceae bacterium DSM 111021]|nr:helix-turn-helix transcriptional regulator [Aerococcaceae bacterium DSM 111021]
MRDRESTGHFLLELRRDKNLSQEEVAQALNVSEDDLTKWERGSKLPEMSQV